MPVTLTHKKKQTRPDGSTYYVQVETEYTTVHERVAALHDQRNGTSLVIETGIADETDKHITCWARVTTPAGTFSGHARSSKTASHIEGESPLEVAETSAVGRALGFAGFGIAEGIASADEVKAAKRASRAHPKAEQPHWDGIAGKVVFPETKDTPAKAALRKLYAVAKAMHMDEGDLKGFLQTDSLKALAEHMAGPKGDCDMPHPHALKDVAEGYRTMLRWIEAAK